MKLGRDEVLQVPYMFQGTLARSTQGRIQGRAKIDYGGNLLQTVNECKCRLQQQTKRMHGNDLKACLKKCCYFWFHSEIIFYAFLTFFLFSHYTPANEVWVYMGITLSVCLSVRPSVRPSVRLSVYLSVVSSRLQTMCNIESLGDDTFNNFGL